MWGIFLINVHRGCKIQTCIIETKHCYFSLFERWFGGWIVTLGLYKKTWHALLFALGTKNHTNTQAHMHICGVADYMSRRGRDGWMEKKGDMEKDCQEPLPPSPHAPTPTDSQLPSPSTPSCNLHSSTGSLKPCVRPPPTNYLATLPLSPAQAWCCCMMGFLYIEFHLLVR